MTICPNIDTLNKNITIIGQQAQEIVDKFGFGALLPGRGAHEEMIYTGPGVVCAYHTGANFYVPHRNNASYIDDPIVDEAVLNMGALRMINEPEAIRIHKEFMPYVLD